MSLGVKLIPETWLLRRSSVELKALTAKAVARVEPIDPREATFELVQTS